MKLLFNLIILHGLGKPELLIEQNITLAKKNKTLDNKIKTAEAQYDLDIENPKIFLSSVKLDH